MAAATEVAPGLWRVRLGFVSAYLVDVGDGLVLIDTGTAGSGRRIVEAVQSIGREPGEIRQILVTHCHGDHAGGLAEMKRLTGAPAAMHPLDAAMVREGHSMRPLRTAPGLLNAIVGGLLVNFAPRTIERAEVEQEIQDGETVLGLRAIHAPGHCAGQLVFLRPEHGGALIAADAAANVRRLALSPVYEDVAEGRRTLSKLSALPFQVACFGHGRPILSGASERFAREWPPAA